MKYKVVRIELKDNTVILYLKKIGDEASFIPKVDFSDPMKLLEFGKYMSMAYARAIEELMQFDAYISIDYEEYNLMDLKVGDFVEVEIKQIDKA
jgi:hypothetical protein